MIFKDGLHSTYNKAKSWNIPIVSILWIEACRNHLCVMDPRAYSISNLEQYENPWLYGKVKVFISIISNEISEKQIKTVFILQRVKALNFGAEDKMMIKKPAKSKLVEMTKDDSMIPASPKTPFNSKPFMAVAEKESVSPSKMNNRKDVSQNSRKSLSSSLAVKKSTSGTQSRKTMNGTVEQPKNTIKSMFQKQMEKSQSANDSISDQLAAIDLTVVPPSPKPSEKTIMPGSLHKRVTRRNSMTMSQASGDEIDLTPIPTPTNKIASRKTMFTPRVSDVMEEDKLGSSPAIAPVANKTVNQTAMMDIDKTVSSKCNKDNTSSNNSIIVDAPIGGINQKRWLLDSLSKRKTLYTPQPLDETSMLDGRITPLLNRTCLKFAMNDSPCTQDLVEKSTRAANTTNSTPYGKCEKCHIGTVFRFSQFFFFIIPPFADWTKGMPKLDAPALGNGSASKTLIDEYANTFSSKKIVVSSSRRTLSHISMDIINQRIENLNKNASMHRSRNDSIDQHYGDTDAHIIDCDPSPMKPLQPLISTPDGIKPKPLKRKLFAPPSLFSPVELAPTLKTDTPPNKTAKNVSKRNRDVMSPLASKSTPLSSTASKKLNDKRVKTTQNDADNNNAVTAKRTGAPPKITRRSTMLFQSAEKAKPKIERANAAASNSTELLTQKSVMVFTNMHQAQIDAIKEVC